MKYESPEIIFAGLFEDLHLSGIWTDGKVITDAIPKTDPSIIMNEYELQKEQTNFNLEQFFNQYFTVTKAGESNFQTDINTGVVAHIERLWDVLTRAADKPVKGSSLIPLPYPYVVPGGRFNEIYYWDSYFTMLGLKASGRFDLIESMVQNFAFLIREIGHIPNGNRTYFLSRSQPPFFSSMIELLADQKGNAIYMEYIDVLEKEYQFWMNQSDIVNDQNLVEEHCVQLNNKTILNRYYDNHPVPRAEMYGEDIYTLKETDQPAKEFFGHIKAACESGWDFSARWFDDGMNLSTIQTGNIIPVDLNCLLYHLESILQKAFQLNKNNEKATHFESLANKRKAAIHEYFWDTNLQFYTDYNFIKQQSTSFKSLAGLFPLYFNIATEEQAASIAKIIKSEFLKDGGLVSTTVHSGQQWDAPNGWAPLQWIAIKGLRNYGFDDLANQIKGRWINLNTKVFIETGKLMEKYNVVDTNLKSGGGEYPVQDGFGWTNGVLLQLLKE